MVAGKRVLHVVLAIVAVGAASALAQPAPDRPFVPLEASNCWSCHQTWTPPLRAIVNILPPASAGAAAGEEFDYVVRFQHAWQPDTPPTLRFANPWLDISGAPSLRFAGGPEPIEGLTWRRAIVPDPLNPTAPQDNVTEVHVEAGATYVSWQVQPADTSDRGPLLTLVAVAPDGNETRVDAPGPGQPVHVVFEAEALQAIGGGTWQVGAEATPLPASTEGTGGSLPQLARIDFDLVHDAKFETATLRRLAVPNAVQIQGGSGTVQAWRLQFLAVPEPGESVLVGFGTTPYFEHATQPVSADQDNIEVAPVSVPVVVGSGVPALQFDEDSTSQRPLPVNGPTWTRVSEAVGYASAFLLMASIGSGGMFGRSSRRWLNGLFGSAKRRVAFHNFLSYGLTVAAVVHIALFMVPLVPGSGGLHRATEDFEWTKGILWWGGPAVVAMFGLGVTGALQVPMVRRWGYRTWRVWHIALTVATLGFTGLHMVLDGQNFGAVVPEWQAAVPNPLHESPLP